MSRNTKRKAEKPEKLDKIPPKQTKFSAKKQVTKSTADGVIESPKFTKQPTKCNTPEPSTSRQAMAKLKEEAKKRTASLTGSDIVGSPISRRTRRGVAAKKLPKPPQLDGGTNDSKSTSKRAKPNLKRLQKKSTSTSDDDGIDFKPSPPKNIKKDVFAHLKRIDRRVLSTDNDDEPGDGGGKKAVSMDFWVEVYCESDEKWIVINLFRLKFNCIDDIRVI